MNLAPRHCTVIVHSRKSHVLRKTTRTRRPPLEEIMMKINKRIVTNMVKYIDKYVSLPELHSVGGINFPSSHTYMDEEEVA